MPSKYASKRLLNEIFFARSEDMWQLSSKRKLDKDEIDASIIREAARAKRYRRGETEIANKPKYGQRTHLVPLGENLFEVTDEEMKTDNYLDIDVSSFKKEKFSTFSTEYDDQAYRRYFRLLRHTAMRDPIDYIAAEEGEWTA